jgi:hypothetical protein
MESDRPRIVLTHLFLNPEAQRSLWFDFDALPSFMPDFRSERAGRRLIFVRLDSLFLCILLWSFSRSLICLDF